MNKEELKQYKELRDKTLTTSDVIKGSFTNVISKLKTDDYVLVENQRQKVTMVIQTIDEFVGVKPEPRSFGGKKVSNEKENKLLARTFIKENVYYLMKFESKNITFPEVDKAYIESKSEFLEQFDLRITKQLIEAWKYIIVSPEKFSFDFYLKLHAVIAKEQALEWGVLRSGDVSIGGTDFIPPVPTKKSITDIFDITDKDVYKKAMKMLVRLIKAQPFYDGNKRSAFLITNKYLMDNALGVVVVNDKHFDKFNILLNNYYNNNDEEDVLVNFLVDNCIYNTLTKKLIR